MAESIEEKWKQKWKDSNAFQSNVDSTKEPFFITVPYPYANSALHIGHGRTFVSADIIARFNRLLGKNVLYPMGFHASGTPVLAVADGVKRRDPVQMQTTREAIACYESDASKIDAILETFVDPKAISDYFTDKIEQTFDSVGVSIDWRRSFTTEEPIYQKCIEWQYYHLEKAGILTQGTYPILYSPVDENAVGEDDIKDGDVDKVSIQDMSYILFELKDVPEFQDVYIAVASLRPDALFGTTNMWMKKDARHSLIQVGSQKWVVASAAVEKIKHQFSDVTVIKEFLGQELIGKTVITPLIQTEVIIADAPFIDEHQGTGVVYSSPGNAPHDYMGLELAKQEGRLPQSVVAVNIVTTKDKKGSIILYEGTCPAHAMCVKYGVKNASDLELLEQAKQDLYKQEHFGGVLNEVAGEFAGTPIKKAKEIIHQKLVSMSLGGTLYETSRRAVTRAGNNVIVANLQGQWFLDYSSPEVKLIAHEVLSNMDYKPSRLKDSQKGYIDWVQKRPCARRRGLGTPLPQDPSWIIESLSDSTIYQMFYLVFHLIREHALEPSQLTHDVFDYVFLGTGNSTLISEATHIDESILVQLRESVSYWKAVDVRYTNPPHMSNHLSFLIYHYGLIFPKENWPKNITVAGLLIKDGHKISKSKGNGIPLIQVGKKYGVDLYRLYVAVGASFDSEMDFREEEIQSLKQKFERFKDMVTQSVSVSPQSYDSFGDVDKWLISQFYYRASLYIESMSEFKFREAYVQILYEFLNDMNYHTLRTSFENTLSVLRFIVSDYMILMSPVTPFFTEEMYQKVNDATDFVSVTPYIHKPHFIDADILGKETICLELVALIRRLIDQRKLDSISVIKIYQADKKRFELFDSLSSLLSEKKNFKEIMSAVSSLFAEDRQFIQKFVPKTLSDGLHSYISLEDETEFLEEIKPWLESEFNCKVELCNDDPKKVNQAVPARPSVLVE